MPARNTKTVLLIEDDHELRRVIGESLRSLQWQVLEAEDGEAGLALARQQHPEVVVCDLLMPRCNGFQVIRALKADPELRPCRIIAISGRSYAVDRFNALEAGADEFLTKPFSPAQLVELMEQDSKCAATASPKPVTASGAFSQPIQEACLRFWGVRGSIPTPGPETVFYGGNTSCVEVRADGEIIILDAGTGIRGLGRELAREFGERPVRVTLLLTHTHWDHIQGMPFFAPVYGRGNRVRVLGFEGAREGLANVLSSQMESPYFPVGLKELPATIAIEEMKEMECHIGSVRVSSIFVNHPGVCVGYRLDTSRGSVAFFPDSEPHLPADFEAGPGQDPESARQFAAAQDARMVRFLDGVDHLILDSQYDETEYRAHRAWGHGSVDESVALALRARARHLYLFHHDPSHDDGKVSRMVAHARQLALAAGSDLRIEAAREGERVALSGQS